MRQHPSPYIVRKELTNPAYFYGRKRELQEVLGLIYKSQPQNVQLVGPRRIGKSFVLQNIARNAELQASVFGNERDRFTIILWNLARRPPENPEHFYRDFVRLLREHLPPALANEFLLEAADDDELDEVVDEGLEALQSAGHHVILLVDELQVITSNPAFPAPFFSRLRNLAETSALAFVIATHRPLSELTHSGEVADSPFFNIFTKVGLGLLSPDETRSFLTIPFSQQRMTFDKGALTEVERLTGGHPCMLATLGDLLWARSTSGEMILQPHIADFRDRLYASFEADFADYWQSLPAPAQNFARKLADGNEVAGHSPTYKMEIRELETRSLCRSRQGRMLLFSPLFDQYVDEHGAPLSAGLNQFKDVAIYGSAFPEILRARLNHSPVLPPDWRSYMEQAIRNVSDAPGVSCLICGRPLLFALLDVIVSREGMMKLSGEGATGQMLGELKKRWDAKAYGRILLQGLWYLKHLGDCGAHPEEYDLTTQDACDVIAVAITVCQRLMHAGYSA